jgi:hypothetical protein
MHIALIISALVLVPAASAGGADEEGIRDLDSIQPHFSTADFPEGYLQDHQATAPDFDQGALVGPGPYESSVGTIRMPVNTYFIADKQRPEGGVFSRSGDGRATFGIDERVRTSNSKTPDVHPGLAADNFGNLWMVFEDHDFSPVRISVNWSNDGGENWQLVGHLAHKSADLKEPSIAVGTFSHQKLVIAYIVDDGASMPFPEVATADLYTDDFEIHSVPVWPWEGYAKPVVFIDAYLGLWWHAWLTCEGIVDSKTENINVCFWDSFSNTGSNWQEGTVLFGDSDDEAWRDPDGSIGTPTHRLYVTCFNTDNGTLYSMRTEDYTGAWLHPVSVQKFAKTPNHAVDPEIETAVDHDHALICCTISHDGNDDIGFTRSNDGGDTWSTLSSLPGYAPTDEYAPALHRNDYGGSFHVAFTTGKNSCFYSAAPQDFSSSFQATPDRVDDTGTVDEVQSKKGIASSWLSDVPGIAWADFRDGTPDLDTYFDRVDDPHRLYVPEEYASIQAAVDVSSQYSKVHVNAGTYFENLILDDKSADIRSVFGPEDTVLDGGHSGSVVTCLNNDWSSIEGFTIRNGYAGSGGGVYCDDANTKFERNIIRDNEAWYGGGGAFFCITDRGARIYKNWIFDNQATTGNGGAVYASDADPSLSCNVIHDNSAAQSGGAVFFDNCESHVSGNTMTKNAAGEQGGGFHIEGPDSPEIWNCIIWNNTAVSNPEIHVESGSPDLYYTDVKGGFPGGYQCIDADPLFVDPDSDDYQLSRYSPCINMGSWYSSSFYDILWRKRPYNGIKDLGAYEFMGPCSLSNKIINFFESQQNVADLTLDAGPINGKRPYMIFGTVSGFAPGVPLPNGDKFLPINWDVFTDMVMELVNSPVLVNFSGTLDSLGKATATIDTLGPLPPGTAYLEMHFAFACPYRDPDGWFASNPIRIAVLSG